MFLLCSYQARKLPYLLLPQCYISNENITSKVYMKLKGLKKLFDILTKKLQIRFLKSG